MIIQENGMGVKDMEIGKDMLLLIDMQRVYLPGKPWGCAGIERAVERIRLLLDKRAGGRLIFTRFLADPAGENVWARYNSVNSEINEDASLNAVLPEFLPYIKSGEAELVDKTAYSCFSVGRLREEATECTRAGGSIVLAGVVAECCVLSTFFQAVDMGCHLIYLRDAVAGISEETEGAALAVVEGLCPLHAEILTTEEYLARQTLGAAI